MALIAATRITTGATAILNGMAAARSCNVVCFPSASFVLLERCRSLSLSLSLSLSYRFAPRPSRHDLITREEGLDPVLDPAIGLGAVDGAVGTVEARLLEEEEGGDEAVGGEADGPPVLDWPVGLGGDEAREGGAGRDAEVDGEVEQGVGAAVLVVVVLVVLVGWAVLGVVV